MGFTPDLEDIIGQKIEEALVKRGENIDTAFGGTSCADLVRVCTVREICKLLSFYNIPVQEVVPTADDLPIEAERGIYLAQFLAGTFTDESKNIGIRVTKHVI